jgi:hypothetical protein
VGTVHVGFITEESYSPDIFAKDHVTPESYTVEVRVGTELVKIENMPTLQDAYQMADCALRNILFRLHRSTKQAIPIYTVCEATDVINQLFDIMHATTERAGDLMYSLTEDIIPKLKEYREHLDLTHFYILYGYILDIIVRGHSDIFGCFPDNDGVMTIYLQEPDDEENPCSFRNTKEYKDYVAKKECVSQYEAQKKEEEK